MKHIFNLAMIISLIIAAHQCSELKDQLELERNLRQAEIVADKDWIDSLSNQERQDLWKLCVDESDGSDDELKNCDNYY